MKIFLSNQLAMDGKINSKTMGLSITSIVKILTDNPTLVDQNQQGGIWKGDQKLRRMHTNLPTSPGCEFEARFVIACENHSFQDKDLKLWRYIEQYVDL